MPDHDEWAGVSESGGHSLPHVKLSPGPRLPWRACCPAGFRRLPAFAKTRLLEAKMGVGIPLERPRKGLLQKSTKCLIGIIRSELDCAMRPLNARWALETA